MGQKLGWVGLGEYVICPSELVRKSKFARMSSQLTELDVSIPQYRVVLVHTSLFLPFFHTIFT